MPYTLLSAVRYRMLLISAMLVFALLPGCGGQRVYKVDPELARQTLTQVLEEWKSGSDPESLRSAQPEIVVQDFDWTGGATLVDYEVVDDGESLDANLMVKVQLTLLNDQQKESLKTVTYLVGTAPVRTVFRDMFH